MSGLRILVVADSDVAQQGALLGAAQEVPGTIVVLQPPAGPQSASQLCASIASWWNVHPFEGRTLVLVGPGSSGIELAAHLAASLGGDFWFKWIGDIVRLTTPKGEEEFEVVDVSYREPATSA